MAAEGAAPAADAALQVRPLQGSEDAPAATGGAEAAPASRTSSAPLHRDPAQGVDGGPSGADWEKQHGDTLERDNVWKGGVAVVVAIDDFEDSWRPPLPHAKEDGELLSETFQVLGYDKVWDLSSAQPCVHTRRGPRHHGYDTEPITCGALSWNQVKNALKVAYSAAQKGAAVVLCVTTRADCNQGTPTGFCLQQRGDVVPLDGPSSLFAQLAALTAEVDGSGSAPSRSIVAVLDIAVTTQPREQVPVARPTAGIAALVSFTPTCTPIFMAKVIDNMLEIVEQDRRDGGWPLTIEMLALTFDDSEAGWARWVKRETLDGVRERCVRVERARRTVGGNIWGTTRWEPLLLDCDGSRMDGACLVLLATSVRALHVQGRKKVLVAMDRPVGMYSGQLPSMFNLLYDSVDGLASLGLASPEQLQPLQCVIQAQQTSTYLKAWEAFRTQHSLQTAELQYIENSKSEGGRMTAFLKFGSVFPDSSRGFERPTGYIDTEQDWCGLEKRYVDSMLAGVPFYFGLHPDTGVDADRDDLHSQGCRVLSLKLRIEGVFTVTPQSHVRLLIEKRSGVASMVLRERGGQSLWHSGNVPSELSVIVLSAEGRKGRPKVPAEHVAGIRHVQDLRYNTQNATRVKRAKLMDTQKAFHSEQQGVARADPEFRVLCDWLEITPAIAVEAVIRIQSVHRMAAVRTRFRKMLWQLHGDGLWPLAPGATGHTSLDGITSPVLERDGKPTWMPPDGRIQRQMVRRWMLACSRLLEWRVMSPRVECMLHTGAAAPSGTIGTDIITQEDIRQWQMHYNRVRGVDGSPGLAARCCEYLTTLVRKKNPTWRGRVDVVLDGIGGKMGSERLYCRLRVLSEWVYNGDQVPLSVYNHIQALAQELEDFLGRNGAGRQVREEFRVANAKLTGAATPGRTHTGMARTAPEAIRDVLGARSQKWRHEHFHGELTSVKVTAEAADVLWPAVTTFAKRGELHPKSGDDTVEAYACHDGDQEALLLPPERGDMDERALPYALLPRTRVREEPLPDDAGPFQADQWALVSWVHKSYIGWYVVAGGSRTKVPLHLSLNGEEGVFGESDSEDLGTVSCDRSTTGNAVRLRFQYRDAPELHLTGIDEGHRVIGYVIGERGEQAGPFEINLVVGDGISAAAGPERARRGVTRRAYVQRARYVEHAVLACRRALDNVDFGDGGEAFRRMLEVPLLPGRSQCSMRVEVFSGWVNAEGPRRRVPLLCLRELEAAGSLAAFLGVEFEAENSTRIRTSKRAELRPGMHIAGVDTSLSNAPRHRARIGLAQRDVLEFITRSGRDQVHSLIFEVGDWDTFLGCRPTSAARHAFQRYLKVTEILDCARRQGEKTPVPELPGIRRLEKTPYIYYSRYWADEGYFDDLPNFAEMEENERVRMLLPTVVGYRDRNSKYSIQIFRDTWRSAFTFLPSKRKCCGKQCGGTCQVFFAWLLTYVCLGVLAMSLFTIPRIITNMTTLVYNYDMTELDIEQVTTWLLIHSLILLGAGLCAGLSLSYIRAKFAFRLRSVLVFICAKYSRLISADMVFKMRNEDIRLVVDLLFLTFPRLMMSIFVLLGCLSTLMDTSLWVGLVSLLYLILRLAMHASYDMFLVRHMTAIRNIQEEEQLKWIVLKGPSGVAGHVAAQQADDTQMRLCLFAREKREIGIDNQIFHTATAVTDWVLQLVVPGCIVYLAAKQVAESEDLDLDLAQQVGELPYIFFYFLLLIAAFRQMLGSASELVEHRSPIARVMTVVKWVMNDSALLSEEELSEIDDLLSLDRDDSKLRSMLHVQVGDPGSDDDSAEAPRGVSAEYVTHMRGRLTTKKVLLHIDWFDEILQEHPFSLTLLYLCFVMWVVFLIAFLVFVFNSWSTECETVEARCFVQGTSVQTSAPVHIPMTGDLYGQCTLMHPIAFALKVCANSLAHQNRVVLSNAGHFTAALDFNTWQSGRIGFYKRFRFNDTDPCPTPISENPWVHFREVDEALIQEEAPLEDTFHQLCFAN
eukprot:TRINITY_DN5307_c0_g1_i1.p1 TRINITY_DN5307_c0_g1~~TRINITY_DN5307_c0_g1_i1.p1  ORF type:complete len:2010 (+),score=579.91 TRINITY_DN5307_c0_g1_i1:57-6032(+)